MKELAKYLVESPDTAEACGQGNFGHRQIRLVDQLLGEEDATGLGHNDGRCAQMLDEQSPKMTFTDAEAVGERLDIGVVFVKHTIRNKRQGPGHGIGGSAPGCQVSRADVPAGSEANKPVSCGLRASKLA